MLTQELHGCRRHVDHVAVHHMLHPLHLINLVHHGLLLRCFIFRRFCNCMGLLSLSGGRGRGGCVNSRLLLGLLRGCRRRIATMLNHQTRGPGARERSSAPRSTAKSVKTSSGRVEGHGQRVRAARRTKRPTRDSLSAWACRRFRNSLVTLTSHSGHPPIGTHARVSSACRLNLCASLSPKCRVCTPCLHTTTTSLFSYSVLVFSAHNACMSPIRATVCPN